MRILIVEDDPRIKEFLEVGLRAEKHTVDATTTGSEGQNLALQNAYELIILDYVLPDTTGVVICNQLRHSGVQAHIIGLSVRSDSGSKVAFLDAGADDYVTKPFSLHELSARIRALGRRSNAVSPAILTVRDICLNVQAHTVVYKDQPVHLTRKEFMLLEYLLRNRGSVMSRGMILEHVWDINTDPFTKTIETHIMLLRQKIDPDKNNRLIKTVAGVGYKID